MTSEPTRPTSADAAPRTIARRVEGAALVVAFLAVHVVLGYLAVTIANQPLGDVTITYRNWVTQGVVSGRWVGLDSDSVYPIVALVPMILAASGGVASIGTGWLVLMTLLDLGVLAMLWRRRVAGVRVAWWWTVFLLALGPIAVGRIDTVATALALVAVVVVAARPGLAAALFTLAAWVKVWPAALAGVLIGLRRGRRREATVGAIVVSGVVVAIDLVLGGGAHLLSFVGEQAGRGLQIESPLATPFLWRAQAGVPDTSVYYDQQILTFQVSGSGTAAAAALSTPLMVLVTLTVVLLAVRAVLGHARRAEVAPVLAMALTAALIVTNKVGSPQYVGWFAVPVVWGLIAGAPSARRFLLPATTALVAAIATQMVYPAYYDRILALDPPMLVVLSVRNALEIGLLVWAMVTLARLSRRGHGVEGRITARGQQHAGSMDA